MDSYRILGKLFMNNMDGIEKYFQNMVNVAVPVPLNRTYTYSCDSHVRPGVRVLVPFGSKKIIGVVLSHENGYHDKNLTYQIKNIFEVLDEEPVYSEVLLELAQWMSEYYFYPIGEILKSMLPSGTAKVSRVSYSLSKKARDRLNLDEPECSNKYRIRLSHGSSF